VTNKACLQRVFAALAEGDGAPFRDVLADDVAWTLTGTTRWSRTYRGKRAVLDELLAPLFARFGDRYTAIATRLIAEDDLVVVEARGRVTTVDGRPYHNRYCYVCRFEGGKVVELVEYMDTALVDAVLS
jgi:uncharacterized protein